MVWQHPVKTPAPAICHCCSQPMNGAQAGKLPAWPGGDVLEGSWTCEPGHSHGLKDRCSGSCPPLLSLPEGWVFCSKPEPEGPAALEPLCWARLGWVSFRAFCFCLYLSTSRTGLADSSYQGSLALSPNLLSDLTPLRSPASSLPDPSWKAVTNVLEGESSAKYKNPLTPWMQKVPRGSVSFPPKPILLQGDRRSLFMNSKQINTKEQQQQHCLNALWLCPEDL